MRVLLDGLSPVPRDRPTAAEFRDRPTAVDLTGGAQAASSANAGAVASAVASYGQRVRAHLMRFHQYPAGASPGTARMAFTISRSGQVLASRLAGSSGVAALDAQATAMVRKASPFPAFPPEITQGSMSFTVPVAFTTPR